MELINELQIGRRNQVHVKQFPAIWDKGHVLETHVLRDGSMPKHKAHILNTDAVFTFLVVAGFY